MIHNVSQHACISHNWDYKNCTPSIEEISSTAPNRINTLNKREMYWIYHLNTLTPYGLNVSSEKVY